GSRTVTPILSRRSARAVNGSHPTTLMGPQFSLNQHRERLSLSAFATSSISPDSQTGTWASLKSFPLTNGGASSSAPKPSTSGIIPIGVAQADAAAQPTPG